MEKCIQQQSGLFAWRGPK